MKRLLAAALALAACGFGPLAAVGAALGFLSRKRLRSLANPAQGMRWANAAIGVGLLNSALWVAAWTWITLEPPARDATRLDEASAAFGTRPMAIPSYRDFPEIETLPAGMSDGADDAAATWTRFVGNVLLTDVGSGVRSLSVTLEEQAQLAAQRGRTPVLWLVASDCEECSKIVRALAEPPLQSALDAALLIRVDSTQFSAELSELKIPDRPVPSFAVLAEDGTPADLLHPGEWNGADVSRMAPLLETFVRRRPLPRRYPWRGGPRADETPI